MPRIRKVAISRFRGIRDLEWYPSPGLNCLIGPGDSGKSSILDAIDLCLGARRTVAFSDADFFRLNVETPISIEVTLGDLDDRLKNLDAYGLHLRGFFSETQAIEDEPERDAETVLTVKLTVSSDLEPVWALKSDRAEAQGLTRDMRWSDRTRHAPTRIGTMGDYHLGWRRGSVLNRLSDETADPTAAMAQAARDARAAFGDSAHTQLAESLRIIAATAEELGIPVGNRVTAMLDPQSVSFSGGTISLHDEDGVPLRGLGVGSTRLLIAGLQRVASSRSSIILIDELEYGLEPHRIIRLLGSLGAKEATPPLQVFMTTHSPVALRELSGAQLFVTRSLAENHEVRVVGTSSEIQSTIRLYPVAFLAPKVIVCEGASEVGIIRGLDQFRTANGSEAIAAQGTALIDCGGGESDRPYRRAGAFHALGYRVAVLRDDDGKPTESVEAAFIAGGGEVMTWRDGRALEDELFLSLTHYGVGRLLERAVELHGETLVNNHLKSASRNGKDLSGVRDEIVNGAVSLESRTVLGVASRTRKAGWFKSVTWMEDVARDIVGEDLAIAESGFRELLDRIFEWAGSA